MHDILIPVIIVAVIGLIAGIILTVLSKVLYVAVDEKQAAIRDVLPGANCGACGFKGCDDYAKALAGENPPAANLCLPGAGGTAEAIAEVLGIKAEAVEKKVAVVRCGGSAEVTDTIMTYGGVQSCIAAKQFYGGQWACSHGCLGLGDCVSVCEYGALSVVNGLAVVDRDLCMACGLCVKTCPNHVITIAPASKQVYVGCNSPQAGAKVIKTCKEGCIGCRKCEKVCKFEAITVENNLASIDFDKCKNCGLCAKECPTHAIKDLRIRHILSGVCGE